MRFSTRFRLTTLALSLTLCLVLAGTALAASRGISVKTKAGKQINLYKGSYALLVGVSNYTAGWPKLESIPREVNAVAEVLKAQGFQVKTVIDPNGKQLEQAFENFVDNYGYDADNCLLFFYSGHGFTRKNGRLGYLVPTDAPLPNRDLKGFLRKSLTMNRIMSWCRGMEAKHALFLFDSCFSGTVFKAKSAPVPKYISTKTARPVRQFISAGSAKQEVPAQSVFAPSFVRGVQGEADRNKDGYVTGSELGEYLLEKVPYYNEAQTPQYGKIRDPNLDEGDFVFLLAGGPGPTPKVKLPPPPPAPPKAPSTDELAALEEKAKRKAAWYARQKRMDAYWAKLEKLDASSLSAKEKAQAWQGALSKFKDDNPFSDEDESLRKHARVRLAHWEGRAKNKRESPPEPAPERLWVTDRLQLPIRNKPEFQSRVLGTVSTGQWVKPLSSEKEGWVKVRTQGGHEGWMLNRYLMNRKPALALIAKNQTPKPPKDSKWITDSLLITLRSGKGAENKILGILHSGDRVELVSRAENGWVKVRTHKNLQGWVLQRYLVQERPAKVRLQNSSPGNIVGTQQHSKTIDNPKEERFTKDSSGVITDSRTGLQWYVGPDKDTNWYDAKKWVESLTLAGGGWRMPSRSELRGLYQKGTRRLTLAPIFKTTGWDVWSGEICGAPFAWLLTYTPLGGETCSSRSRDMNFRVFAVRSAPKKAALPSAGPKPKSLKRFTNSIGQKFVLIPAGSFMMGSKFSPEETTRRFGIELDKYIDEHPRHKVTISKSFYMQTTEVTQAQWKAVMGNNPSDFKNCGGDCPAEQVSWNDVQEFIKRLNRRESTNKYRLPTEAEWEYAARAGGTGAYCFGDDKSRLGDYAWYGSNSGNKTHPVGTKKPNRWGLYDMHGNVWEWVQDWHKIDYYGSSPKTDPLCKDSASNIRGLRGGPWIGNAGSLRSAARAGDRPTSRFNALVGFRLARGK